MTLEMSAAYGGVTDVSFYNWMKRGEKDLLASKRTIYSKFFKDVKMAEPEALANWLAVIERSAKGVYGKKVTETTNPETGDVERTETPVLLQNPQWPAAAWKAERRYPRIYGRPPVVQQKISAEGENASVSVRNITDGDLDKLIEEYIEDKKG